MITACKLPPISPGKGGNWGGAAVQPPSSSRAPSVAGSSVVSPDAAHAPPAAARRGQLRITERGREVLCWIQHAAWQPAAAMSLPTHDRGSRLRGGRPASQHGSMLHRSPSGVHSSASSEAGGGGSLSRPSSFGRLPGDTGLDRLSFDRLSMWGALGGGGCGCGSSLPDTVRGGSRLAQSSASARRRDARLLTPRRRKAAENEHLKLQELHEAREAKVAKSLGLAAYETQRVLREENEKLQASCRMIAEDGAKIRQLSETLLQNQADFRLQKIREQHGKRWMPWRSVIAVQPPTVADSDAVNDDSLFSPKSSVAEMAVKVVAAAAQPPQGGRREAPSRRRWMPCHNLPAVVVQPLVAGGAHALPAVQQQISGVGGQIAPHFHPSSFVLRRHKQACGTQTLRIQVHAAEKLSGLLRKNELEDIGDKQTRFRSMLPVEA